MIINLKKANVVVDSLSQKSLFALRALNAQLILNHDCSILAELKARPVFLQRIEEFQNVDPKLVAKRDQIQSDSSTEFSVGIDSIL